MSPWFILLLSKLDAITNTAIAVLIVHSIIFGIVGLGGFLAGEDRIIDFIKTHSKKLITVPVVCVLILFTVPDRNTAILMWVLPKLSQSQLIQKDFPEMYEKAMKILNEEIEKKLNGDKK